MDDADKFIFIVIAIIFLIGFIGFQIGRNHMNIQLKEELKECELNNEKLEIENQEMKEDVGALLSDYYGRELVWDIFGVTKYKGGLCAMKIILKDAIPLIDMLPC